MKIICPPKPRQTHIFARDTNDRYVEPQWCSRRLFDVESFSGLIHDPACGTGQIVASARAAGLRATGADIAPCIEEIEAVDFFQARRRFPNIVSNPPYGPLREFALHALSLALRKVALLVPIARLNAAGCWLAVTSLRRVWLLSPRPSIPPHSLILSGRVPSGGRIDFCWLVWEQRYRGAPELGWLWRDGVP
jgi:hypothetical protein